MTQYVIKNDNFINILNGSTLPAKSLNPELVSSISIFKNNTSIVNFRNENKDPKPHKWLYLIWTRLIVLLGSTCGRLLSRNCYQNGINPAVNKNNTDLSERAKTIVIFGVLIMFTNIYNFRLHKMIDGTYFLLNGSLKFTTL